MMSKYNCKTLRTILLMLLTFPLFSSCLPRDPSKTGAAPRARGCEWVPTCYMRKEVSVKAQNCPLPDLSQKLDLLQLVDVALWNNPETKRTWATARAAAFNLGMQKSTLYPAVNLQEVFITTKQNFGQNSTNANVVSSGSSVGFGGAGGGTGVFDILETNLMVTYLIWDFGGREANIEAARQMLYAADWKHNWTLQTVINNVLDAYYAFITARAMYIASLSNLEDSKVTLEATEQMLFSGVKTIADVLQAKANYSGVVVKVEQAYGNLKTGMGKLARQLGLKADSELNVELEPEELPLDKVRDSVENLMTMAKEHRPDLAAMQSLLLQKEAQLRVAQSESLPTLATGFQAENFLYFNPCVSNGNVYSTGFLLSVPIFQGFYHLNQIRKAKAEIQVAYADLLNKEEDIFLEVLVAYYDFQTAIETVKHSEEYLKYSKQNYDVASANYKQGTGTIIDLLNAMETLADARAQKIQARSQWLTSLANIAYSTGTIGRSNL